MGRVNVVVRLPKLHAKAWLGGWNDEASAIKGMEAIKKRLDWQDTEHAVIEIEKEKEKWKS